MPAFARLSAIIMVAMLVVATPPRLVAADTSAQAGNSDSAEPVNNESLSSPSPRTVFGWAQTHWSAETPPRHVRYVIGFHAMRNGKAVENHYRALYDSADAEIKVSRFSVEENSRPAEGPPPGVNFNFEIRLSSGGGPSATRTWRVSQPPPSQDFLGYPELSPRYAFGLVKPTSTPNVDVAPSAAPSGLTTIGGTRTLSRIYDIVFAPDETTSADHHLLLRPFRSPEINRIRELWIDRTTHAVHKMVTAGNFTEGPSQSVNWEISYVEINDVTYLSKERALGTIDDGHNGSYASAEFSFESLEVIPPTEQSLILTLPLGSKSLHEPG